MAAVGAIFRSGFRGAMALPQQQRAWSSGSDQVASVSVVRLQGLGEVFAEEGRRAVVLQARAVASKMYASFFPLS